MGLCEKLVAHGLENKGVDESLGLVFKPALWMNMRLPQSGGSRRRKQPDVSKFPLWNPVQSQICEVDEGSISHRAALSRTGFPGHTTQLRLHGPPVSYVHCSYSSFCVSMYMCACEPIDDHTAHIKPVFSDNFGLRPMKYWALLPVLQSA